MTSLYKLEVLAHITPIVFLLTWFQFSALLFLYFKGEGSPNSKKKIRETLTDFVLQLDNCKVEGG